MSQRQISKGGARRRAVRGFTLIESLVALIVLSIGMLGIAALYLETLRAGRSALYRTQAVTMASDLADRIRANRTPTNTYTGAGQNAVAQADLTDWNDAVATLPDGAGEVRFIDGLGEVPSTYVIRVSWTDVGQDDSTVYELRLEI